MNTAQVKVSGAFMRSVRMGLAAARANIVPAAMLWTIAIGLVVAYYSIEPVRGALGEVAALKDRYGLLYSMVSTALFGGLLPLVFQSIPRSTRSQVKWRHLPFFLIFWAVKGAEIDLFYRWLAFVFGDGNDVATILPKVLFDMFVWGPLWAVPSMALTYIWKDCGYSWQRFRQRLGKHWYRERVLPVFITNLAIWIPAVSAIYSFPSVLQLPVQNIILCMFVLLVLFLTKEHGEDRSSL